jgi:c(7)-type cytochrome triheme protein
MKPIASLRVLLTGLFLAGFFVVAASFFSWGQDSSFREEFITNYKAQRFQQQVILVKKNKDLIADEIDSLIEEAMQEDKSFEERMYLLDIASTMGFMHKYWNDDDEPLNKVEPYIYKELKKEEQRTAELMKWKKEERFLGNFVMKTRKDEMEKEGLAPVLYPHWLHRIYFECKVCHDDIFTMKRWSNDISQEKIVEGKQCGTCHNGTISFAADKAEECDRCHIAGKPEAEKFHNINEIEHEYIAVTAERLGAEWNTEALPEGTIPVDKFQFIDWLELKRKGVFKPIVSLDPDFKDEIRDNMILFESTSDFVQNVIFNHKVHSEWIKCSTCHPAHFKDELGGSNVKMIEISRGRFCGLCHGKVSFTFADCLRCHNQPKGVVSEGVLVRKKEVEGLPAEQGQTEEGQ